METLDTATASEIVEDIESGVFQQWLDSLIPKFWSFVWCVILAFVVYFIGSQIIKIILRINKKAMDRHEWEPGVENFIQQMIKYLLYILLFVTILGLFGITTTSISAAIAGMGVTIGLALQGALSNFAGGVLILITHPFKVGDYIIEDANKNQGTVIRINIIYTTLQTGDGQLVQIPNGTLAATSLTNVSASEMRRINETVGISYSSDIKKAKEIIQYIIDNTKTKLPDEPVDIFVAELADSAVKIGFRFYTSTDDYWATKWAVLEEIKDRFDNAGIDICYNQLDVHIDNIK